MIMISTYIEDIFVEIKIDNKYFLVSIIFLISKLSNTGANIIKEFWFYNILDHF
jgi:hypothetical protein